MSIRTALLLIVTAAVAIAAWPFAHERARAESVPTPAPVIADYLRRDATIAYWERQRALMPRDQNVLRSLALQYLRHFQERASSSDLARAERAARHALALQPNNADDTRALLIDILEAGGRYREALPYARLNAERAPHSASAAGQLALIDVETGDLAGAQAAIAAVDERSENTTFDIGAARVAERTGDLREARRLITRAGAYVDAVIDSPAVLRAWYHDRAAELALAGGDAPEARRAARTALSIFPGDRTAKALLARLPQSGGT